jgi:hypothetical protein
VTLDNYGSHKHPKLLRWACLSSALGLPLHADSRLLLKAVATFFSSLTPRRLKRGSFHAIVDPQAAIHPHIAEHNDHSKPFTWTDPAADPR